MIRLTGLFVVVAAVSLSGTRLEPSADAPRNDLPQPYRTTRDCGIAFTRDDTIYVADSESGPDTGARELTGIRKGIRIGRARDGKVTAFIEDSESTTPDHSGAEGVGVDAQGNVYGGVVRRRMLERHVRIRQ